MRFKRPKKILKNIGLIWQALRKFLDKIFKVTSAVRFSTHSLHALRINMRLISRKSPSVICREKCPQRISAFLRRKDFAVLDSNVKMLRILNIHSMELKILG